MAWVLLVNKMETKNFSEKNLQSFSLKLSSCWMDTHTVIMHLHPIFHLQQELEAIQRFKSCIWATKHAVVSSMLLGLIPIILSVFHSKGQHTWHEFGLGKDANHNL